MKFRFFSSAHSLAKAPVRPACLRRIGLLLVLCLSAGARSATDLAVVTRKDTPIHALTRQQVADLFLGRRRISVQGQPLMPIDLSDPTLRQDFYKRTAEMSVLRVNAYWARLVFSGKGRPPPKLSPDQATMRVQSRPNTITYLPLEKAGPFKVLLTLPASEPIAEGVH